MIIETIEYNGHTIELCHDDDSHNTNPFNDNDAMSSVVYSSQSLAFHNCSGIEIPELSYEQLKLNADLIRQAMNTPVNIGDQQDIEDYIEYGASNRETIELLFVLNQAAGIPCVLVDGHGSCQGDWHKILIMLESEYIKDFPHPERILNSMAKEFELWAYGNVHGYRVFKQDTCKCCGHTALEHIDSCWGFLCEQNDDTWQYMIECAKEATT